MLVLVSGVCFSDLGNDRYIVLIKMKSKINDLLK